MTAHQTYQRALIVGAGSGLSAALARLFVREGMQVALAARNPGKLKALCTETGGHAFACDATKADEVQRLFVDVEHALGTPDVVVYNASGRVRGPLVDIDPAEVERAIATTGFGGFLVAQEAARRMLPGTTVRFFSRGHPPASRVMRSPRRSPWASSRCEVSRRAWRASSAPRVSMSRIS